MVLEVSGRTRKARRGRGGDEEEQKVCTFCQHNFIGCRASQLAARGFTYFLLLSDSKTLPPISSPSIDDGESGSCPTVVSFYQTSCDESLLDVSVSSAKSLWTANKCTYDLHQSPFSHDKMHVGQPPIRAN